MALALRHPFGGRDGRAGSVGREERNQANDDAGRPPRRSARVAAARGAWAIGSVMLMVTRIVRLAVSLLVLLIVAAIVLRLAGANPGNVIVRDIHDGARALVGPFKNMFSIKDAKAAIAVNWGIAALVYLLIGSFIARLIARAAPRGLPPSEPVA